VYLLVNSGGVAAVAEWQALFAPLAPGLRVAHLDDPSVPAEQVAYVFVWDPPPGRLAQFANLRLIVSSGAGVEHITRDTAWPSHVPIVRMGGTETAQRMGDYVCWAALSLLRGARRMALAQAAARWDNFDVPFAASDLRAGVMGVGHLGTKAATMLRDLGFRTAGWSRTEKDIPGIQSFAGDGARDRFLARTDILVCLLPVTPATEGIVNAGLLARLPPGAAVINAGRGSHLVLPDLLAALDSGHLSGAVLDVFPTEPLAADHPVWSHPKVTVTPHVASLASRPTRARFVADAIAAFERGEALPHPYDPARGY
jgi:glyoxylate/hydroxypyruvate reductase A